MKNYKEEMLFWAVFTLITLGIILILGEITGTVDGFINSFSE